MSLIVLSLFSAIVADKCRLIQQPNLWETIMEVGAYLHRKIAEQASAKACTEQTLMNKHETNYILGTKVNPQCIIYRALYVHMFHSLMFFTHVT